MYIWVELMILCVCAWGFVRSVDVGIRCSFCLLLHSSAKPTHFRCFFFCVLRDVGVTTMSSIECVSASRTQTLADTHFSFGWPSPRVHDHTQTRRKSNRKKPVKWQRVDTQSEYFLFHFYGHIKEHEHVDANYIVCMWCWRFAHFVALSCRLYAIQQQTVGTYVCIIQHIFVGNDRVSF